MKFKLAVLLLFAAPVFAKQHNVHIFIEDSTGDTEMVESALAGKIGATERYALTTADKSELDIHLTCIKLKNIEGYVCDTVVFAFGPMGIPSYLGKASMLVTSSTAQRAAEMLFNNFVGATTDEAIEAAETFTTKQVSNIVLAYEKKDQ